MKLGILLCLCLLCFLAGAAGAAKAPTHILAILADDYGWADSGWHTNASDVRTPTMDARQAFALLL